MDLKLNTHSGTPKREAFVKNRFSREKVAGKRIIYEKERRRDR